MRQITIRILVVLLTFSTGLLAYAAWQRIHHPVVKLQREENDQNYAEHVEPLRNRLQWYASEAKKAGKTTATVSGIPYDMLEVVSSGDEAIGQYTILVARMLGRKTTPDGSYIFTFNKLRLLEKLSSPKGITSTEQKGESDFWKPPQEMLPLKHNEFFLVDDGGVMTIDGVTLTQPGINLQVGQTYLLFVRSRVPGIASLDAYSRGVSAIGGDGKLTPFSAYRDGFKELGDSLDAVKASVNQRKKRWKERQR